jgi:hypothetical protein
MLKLAWSCRLAAQFCETNLGAPQASPCCEANLQTKDSPSFMGSFHLLCADELKSLNTNKLAMNCHIYCVLRGRESGRV